MQISPSRPAVSGRTPFYRHLYVQVLVAIALGAVLGHYAPDLGRNLKPLGDAFIRLVSMVIAPVIFLTVVNGIAGMNHVGAVGRVVLKAMAYFLFFSTLALVIGLLAAHLVHPGANMHADPASLNTAEVKNYTSHVSDMSITSFLMEIIPHTVVGAFVSGNVLQVLFFAVLFGIALATCGERAAPVKAFFDALAAPVFKLVSIVMKAAPVGAFGAIAFTIGRYGIGSMVDLAWLVLTFYGTSLFFVLVILGAVARVAGFSIFALIRYLKDELLLVLGTSSSEAAMPSLMEKLERAGCSRSVVGLVVPTGYSFNLDGTNIYMTLAVMFIAQATHTELTLTEQLTVLAVAMLSSKGAAGVTGAGFITLAATLAMVPSVPVAGMALILGVDRFMSECRSLTNFVGNAVATVVVARWEGAFDAARWRAALHGDVKADAADRDRAVLVNTGDRP
ncbi:dicarboxylate/amino acid:cation symporter [Dyella sp.]|uniref:dicarboxylate/amino acid:cation symporter n=1 Tax=Dyella sp. TaxID=1869338 RepID=UPI0039C87147